MQRAAEKINAGVIVVDVGPNLGAINRAALISSDHVVTPMAPDLFSLQGLGILGPRLRTWRKEWQENRSRFSGPSLELPASQSQPAGYIVQQHPVRLDRPLKAYGRWMDRIPGEYCRSVLGVPPRAGLRLTNDPYCLAMLKNYRSLMTLAQEARKPMFRLTMADGAIGSHATAALEAYKDYEQLARQITRRIGVILPTNETSVVA